MKVVCALLMMVCLKAGAHNPQMVTHIFSKHQGSWHLVVSTATAGIQNSMRIKSGKDIFPKAELEVIKKSVFRYVESKMKIENQMGEKVSLKRSSIDINNHQVTVTFDLPRKLEDVYGLRVLSEVGVENPHQINIVRVITPIWKKHYVLKKQNGYQARIL